MYLNGDSLLAKPFRERRNLLKTRFPPLAPDEPTIARFDHVNSIIGTAGDLEPVREFMAAALNAKCEGLMLKARSRRSRMRADDADPRRPGHRAGRGGQGGGA